jgi:hypothetical protein
VFDLQELLHPVSYHAAIHPTDHGREVATKRAKEEAKQKKEAAKREKAQAQAAGVDDSDAQEAKRRKMEARQKMLDAKAKRAAEQEEADAGGAAEAPS